jgi:hypothetical protein
MTTAELNSTKGAMATATAPRRIRIFYCAIKT